MPKRLHSKGQSHGPKNEDCMYMAETTTPMNTAPMVVSSVCWISAVLGSDMEEGDGEKTNTS
jgi:hypothetical protein